MADLQTYRFEPQRVPNPEDSERENEEVNHWSEGTFWCSCERCQIITTQRECDCCRAENSQRKKIKFKVEFQTYTASVPSKWRKNFLCKLL